MTIPTPWLEESAPVSRAAWIRIGPQFPRRYRLSLDENWRDTPKSIWIYSQTVRRWRKSFPEEYARADEIARRVIHRGEIGSLDSFRLVASAEFFWRMQPL